MVVPINHPIIDLAFACILAYVGMYITHDVHASDILPSGDEGVTIICSQKDEFVPS